MSDTTLVDTSFDVRTDAGGRDPDGYSKTLRRYHRLLWSKPLPGGALFDLDADLHHKSALGEYWLASDAITHTYSTGARPPRLAEAVRQAPPTEVTAAYDLGCTVGAYLVFPYPVEVDGKRRQSINQARGLHPKISDRFDLTLECIRRHYQAGVSPLTNALAPYADFFALFGDFRGYVDHFLLNDLVDDGYTTLNFFTDFDDFARSPLPAASVAEYREYLRRSMHFIRARNERIARYASSDLTEPS